MNRVNNTGKRKVNPDFDLLANSQSRKTKSQPSISAKATRSIMSIFNSKFRLFVFSFFLLCLFYFINYSSSLKFNKPFISKLKFDHQDSSNADNSVSAEQIELKAAFLPDTSLAKTINYSKINDMTTPDLPDLDIKTGSLLTPLLVARPVGSAAHTNVRTFLANKLQEYGMKVTLDSFNDTTPLGDKTFTNVIGTTVSKSANDLVSGRRLLLSAHYDSKLFKNFDFIGATDSSVPVAIILSAMKMLKDINFASSGNKNSVQVVFFDGEEAFEDWSSVDSLYGSRHLAAKMHSESDPQLKSFGYNIPQTKMIDLFVLLDLIGSKNPSFYDLNPPSSSADTTKIQANAYALMSKIESDLVDLKILQKRFLATPSSNSRFGSVDDDHRPFIDKNVPILHLISTPFPNVWHTINDNASNLDQYAINHFAILIRAFVVAYLDIQI
ncbi:Glutaminyl-peptide cyclotransferase [Smittium culicis]|uniref:Peptide hydrolase n=1 Tax=Smittium culicis TaxID=133412 RepID=A0A1R1XUU1_9FUNG|nr:Glutaminyl-peptide cyclotransferase [Smittium culicis]